MEEDIKLSVVIELLNKEIAKTNSNLVINSTAELENKLEYLLNLKKTIYLGNLEGINEFLEKYKENKL